ncbi:putative anion transporter 4, chloroplastic [Salvia divinorum]|uniref:Anion transporter 4, chloroplastic n=1 Tax=Salvia divinorum TaxID=28513 RepID=A0ABD1GAD3_SALDI
MPGWIVGAEFCGVHHFREGEGSGYACAGSGALQRRSRRYVGGYSSAFAVAQLAPSFSGVVQSSFLWGYLISPIAGGTLVDRYGESSLLALLATRMLLGIAEGVALPCMNNMIARRFPQTERSGAVGLAMAGFQLGSAIGLTLSPILMSQAGIYGPFVIFGLFGFLWLLVWVSATSSSPDRSPQISKFELRYIQSTSTIPSISKNQVQTRKRVPPFRR